MKISSLDRNIKDALGAGFFEIPRFQRPYSWESENISDFLLDTIDTYDNDYFIGSMVVFKKGDSSFGVVDGQQRLTTITIILSVIRNLFKEIDSLDLAHGVHTLIERSNINAEKVFVLRTETSFPYFQEHILKFDKPEIEPSIGFEEKNLQNSYNIILKYIKSKISSLEDQSIDNKKKLLIAIRDKILSLKIIFIELDNEEDAYVIFETLNTRGKELTSSDLIKNFISRLVQPTNAHLDKVKIIWQEINDKIDQAPGQVTFSNYLQHYWLSRYEYTSNNKLYYSVKKYINKDTVGLFLTDLKKCSEIYRAFYEPSFIRWKKEESKIKDSVEAVDIFNVRSPLPLMLSVLRKYFENGISKKQTESLLLAIEKFIFAYTSISTTQSTGGLSMMYSKLARKLSIASTEAEKNNIVNEIKTSLRDNFPSEETFRIKFKEIQYTEKYTKDRNLIRYILGKYYQCHNPLECFDYRKMTIEHLLPQDKIDSKDSEYSIGCIGNLLLVSNEMNSKLGNKSFQDKKTILKKAGFKLDKEIEDCKAWTSDEISKRLDRMSIEAYNLIWKI